jgi:hypothetical protein
MQQKTSSENAQRRIEYSSGSNYSPIVVKLEHSGADRMAEVTEGATLAGIMKAAGWQALGILGFLSASWDIISSTVSERQVNHEIFLSCVLFASGRRRA